MNKKFFIIFLITGLFTLFSTFAFSKTTITDYQATFIPLYDEKNNLNIAIRVYYIGNTVYFLCVDPNTLQTKTLAAKQTTFRLNQKEKKPVYFSMQMLANTPYLKLLNNFSKPPYKLENYGITKAKNNFNAMFLTIDMCPSTKKFEKRLFLALTGLADKAHQPTPIAISITGLWLLEHEDEFAWLVKQQTNNKLAITWINHSFSHPYYPDLPLKNNFLLSNKKFFTQEVLMTEKLLLEHNQTPSIFFRFPGLISNQELIEKLKTLGLITIGSNAWLAKSEQAKNGDFILIHGNSNEPIGVDKFLMLLNKTPNFLPLELRYIITHID
jgi:hypothetical protein